MSDLARTDLSSALGRKAAAALATAYETAILSLSLGQWERVPNRKVRLALVEVMLTEGRRNGFEPERLAEVGLAAIRDRAEPV